MADALIVFAKTPRPGRVKTRLSPVLTPDESARLYRAFLQDALDQYSRLSPDVRLYLADAVDRPKHRIWGDGPVEAWPGDPYVQQGSGLGERMQQAVTETLADGYDAACIVGTDHPTLPSDLLMQGFHALNGDAALCVGPSADGGFYLIGMTRPTPSLFRGMEYSHPDVFAETRRRMEETGAAHAVLPPWYDVDTPAALRRLMKDLDEEDLDEEDLDEEDLDEESDGEDLNEGSTEPTEEWSRARHTRRALARMNLYERLSAASNRDE